VVQQPKLGLDCLIVEVIKSHRIRHTHTHTHTHTNGGTSLSHGSGRRRGRYLHNTQQTPETNIHALIGIQTREPSSQDGCTPASGTKRPCGLAHLTH